MGISIYYRTLRAVSDEERTTIEAAATSANAGKEWLNCEPVHFFPGEGGYLRGGSKLNLTPHDEDVATAAESGLPVGDMPSLIQVLSQLSRDHHFDWEVVFDQGPPIGFIRNGHCDQEVLRAAEQVSEAARMLASLSP